MKRFQNPKTLFFCLVFLFLLWSELTFNQAWVTLIDLTRTQTHFSILTAMLGWIGNPPRAKVRPRLLCGLSAGCVTPRLIALDSADSSQSAFLSYWTVQCSYCGYVSSLLANRWVWVSNTVKYWQSSTVRLLPLLTISVHFVLFPTSLSPRRQLYRLTPTRSALQTHLHTHLVLVCKIREPN